METLSRERSQELVSHKLSSTLSSLPYHPSMRDDKAMKITQGARRSISQALSVRV